jgi:hypothetical protein
MKIVFAFFFCIYSLKAYSHIVLKGNGKGSVTQTEMTGLHPGDTLAIRAGFYEKGGSFKNLTGITIINYEGLVYFGNTISIGNLKMVTLTGDGWKNTRYGFHFQDIKGDAFILEAPCNELIIAYCEYRNALFQNVVDSISFLDILIDSTSSDVCQVIGHSIYRMLASNWKITGPCPNGKHDAGIFQTSGNGTVCNIYRKGGWGYLWRSWNLGLNGRAESYLYNCIDLSTDNYGTIDTRIEAGDTTRGETRPFIRGANMHVLNNTIGNKQTINYVSELVVAGNYYPENGYVLEVRNNLCFHTVATSSDPIIKQNTVNPLRDTSNNIYCTDPIAAGILLDTILCYLDSTGHAIDRALVIPFIKTDIDGIPRPTGNSSDIGAREFPGLSKIPYSGQGTLPKNLLFLGAVTLLVAIIILTFRYQRKGKVKKTGYLFNLGQENRIKLSNLSSH